MDKYIGIQSPWQTKHKDGGDDEDDVEGGKPDQKAVDGTLHLWPAYVQIIRFGSKMLMFCLEQQNQNAID